MIEVILWGKGRVSVKDLNRMKQSIVLAIGILLASASFTPIILVHAKMTSQELIHKKLIIDKKIIQLERETERLQANLQYKIKEFRQTQSDIADTEKELKEVERRMQDRSKIIDERMVAYQSQKSTINLYVDVLLESESLSDLLTKSISIKTLLDADRSLLNQQTEDRDELKTLQITLQMKKEKLQKQFQAMQEQEKDLEVKKVENNAKSLKLKEQIATKKKKEKLERERIVKEKEAARLKSLAEKEFLAQQVAGESEEVGAAMNAGNGTNGAKVTDANQQVPTVEGSAKVKTIIEEASKYLGTSYVWGGSNPATGFDCSGLTHWSFKKAGISIPRTSAAQYLASKKVSATEARAGDLIFFSYGSGVAHVGIYLGDGRMLNAQNNGVVVESLDWWNQYLVGYGRFI